MNAAYGRRRPLPMVFVLLVIAMLLDRCLIAGLFPWISSMGGISLMVVFLDIPLALPQLDPLPVAVLFSLFYSMMSVSSPARQEAVPAGRLSTIWGGVIVLGLWMLGGAVVYHFVQDLLPRHVRNGIDSFGVHVDVYTPFPAYSIIPFRGGVILLVCFLLGGRSLLKRINSTAVIVAAPVPVIRMSIPEIERPAEPVRPRAVVRSVAIVAPRRVEIEHQQENASTPLY
jgi:hypothetical protein